MEQKMCFLVRPKQHSTDTEPPLFVYDNSLSSEVEKRENFTSTPIFSPVAFWRHFFSPVTRASALAMRLGWSTLRQPCGRTGFSEFCGIGKRVVLLIAIWSNARPWIVPKWPQVRRQYFWNKGRKAAIFIKA